MLPVVQLDNKVCKKCGIVKPLNSFHKNKGLKDGRDNRCLDCFRAGCRSWYLKNKEKNDAQAKAWYQKNKEVVKQRSRDGELLRNFGITRQEYNRIFQIQGGMCKICGVHQSNVNKSLRVDHDHETKKIRGLLCHNCNVSLGLLKENIETLKKMVAYLEGSCSQ
jgi:hypothetical protein